MIRSLTTYVMGFVLSLALSLAPAGLLWWHDEARHAFPSHEMLFVAFALLAILQLGVQLSFFLHIDHEAKPRWNLQMLVFALLVVSILVGGTLWIMTNLSHGAQSGMPFMHGEVSPRGEN